MGSQHTQPSVGEVLHRIQDAAKDIQTIQRDITVVKGSIGLGTVLLNTANFSGVKATSTSSAQVAAQGKGATLPPPPAQEYTHGSKATTAVTAYKDRVVTVKLKDHGIIQRYRNHSAAWPRQQIQTAIRENSATKDVKVVAAHQLKSSDIQVFTSTNTEPEQLKEDKIWVKGRGEQAELVMPIYGEEKNSARATKIGGFELWALGGKKGTRHCTHRKTLPEFQLFSLDRHSGMPRI
ncbi:hypothetical protein CLAIMM_14710 [Cladophialophora immunda]|nr:hypothetical protein CLAIMM_14710 [Cladophialophora immunda]